jgi:flagellar motor switch protein FliM
MLTALLAFGDDGRAGNLGISLPAPALRGLLPTAAAARGSARPRTPSYDRVLPIEVELVVELARLPITIGTLNGLSVGAEIPMGNLAEVIARVDNRPTFAGEAGTSNGLRSLRVERRLDFSSTTGMRDR